MSCNREDCVCLFSPGACECPCNACTAENVGKTKPLPLPKPAYLGRPNFCGGRVWVGSWVQCNANALDGETRCAKCKAADQRRAEERRERASMPEPKRARKS